MGPQHPYYETNFLSEGIGAELLKKFGAYRIVSLPKRIHHHNMSSQGIVFPRPL